MDVSRLVVVGASSPQNKSPLESSTIFANIVLMEKTSPSSDPTLYEFRENAYSLQSMDRPESQFPLMNLDENAFLTMGNVSLIDKEEKKIILADRQTTVFYKHLIIVSKQTHAFHGDTKSEEFSMGLHALIRALRVQTHIPNPMQISQETQQRLAQSVVNKFSSHKTTASSSLPFSAAINQMVKPHLSDQKTPSNASIQGDRKLFEVQL